MTLLPAYNRDYKNKEDVLRDWEANRDFLIVGNGEDFGRYINKADAEQYKVKELLEFKYDGLKKSFILKIA